MSRLVLTVLLLFSVAGTASARPALRVIPVQPHEQFAGDPHNLPVQCQRTPQELIAFARNMPAVQTAMSIFASRGYVARSIADTAIIDCSLELSAVALAYSKPGAFIDSFHVVVPTIVVSTHLTEFGDPVTKVTGGLLVADGQAGLVYSGDSLAIFRDTDHSFDVNPNTGQPAPESMFDPDSRFNRWARCTGLGTVGCFIGVLRIGGPGFTTMKLAALEVEPQIGLAILESCALASGIGCLGNM
jgi:hypothetical protein